MAFARSAEQLVLLRAIQGLITGSVAATSALIAAEAPRDRTGYAMGLLQTGLGLGIAIGPLIGGAFAEAFPTTKCSDQTTQPDQLRRRGTTATRL